MIKIGDTVKVIAATEDASNPDKKKEYIPIGTICTVINIETFSDVVGYAWIREMDVRFGIWKVNLKEDIWNGLKTNREVNKMPTKYVREMCMREVTKTSESETMISAEKLINRFEDMANRGTLLCGKNVTQEDLLIQIVGTIVKVSMDL